MSTSYFMNIGAYVATVIFAAARLAVGGVLTEPGALVPALLVLGILLIPLASKGGFQKSTYQTGPAFGLAWGVLYALTPAQLSSDRISGVLEASLEGLSFSFKDNLAVFCIGLLLLVGLSAVRKYFPNAAFFHIPEKGKPFIIFMIHGSLLKNICFLSLYLLYVAAATI